MHAAWPGWPAPSSVRLNARGVCIKQAGLDAHAVRELAFRAASTRLSPAAGGPTKPSIRPAAQTQTRRWVYKRCVCVWQSWLRFLRLKGVPRVGSVCAPQPSRVISLCRRIRKRITHCIAGTHVDTTLGLSYLSSTGSSSECPLLVHANRCTAHTATALCKGTISSTPRHSSKATFCRRSEADATSHMMLLLT